MRLAALLPSWAWLALFVALPAGIVLLIAFADPADGVPPYVLGLDPGNLALVLTDPLYRQAAAQSVELAGISTALCLALGTPVALAIARAAPARRSGLLLAVMLPFWTGFLLRVTAWIGLLRDDGWINAAFGLVGLGPYRLLYTPFAATIGIVYCYLPFAVLPLYATLSRRDAELELAAADLGAPPWRVFLHVTLPLSRSGVAAAAALTFIPALGEYVIPELLGGPGTRTLGRAVWDEFFADHDWPTAGALAVVLLAALLGPAALLRARRRG